MQTVVLQLTSEMMSEMKRSYTNSLLNKQIPYTVFVARNNMTTITAYTSGKVVFQGKNAESEAKKWRAHTSVSSKASTSTKKKNTTESLPKDFASWSVIGSDEVGNGSYFGPLVVCAAYASQPQLETLKKLGVRDSKELKDAQIISIAEKIKSLIPYQLLVVSPKKYNAIQPQYNAVRMKVALHNQAIAQLLEKIAPQKPDAILIDQFTPENNYKKYVSQEKQQVKEKIYFATKGEQYHLAVAAASIICRASFLEALASASKEVGFPLPSGAGTKSDQVAARLLKKGGVTLLENYAKLHFANTKKAEQLAKD